MFVHKVKIIEVEHLLRKYGVFGIVDTSTGPSIGYMQVVTDRSAATLLPIIQRVCRPGTIIHSDMWAGYKKNRNQTGFEHHTVNQKLHFLNPTSGTHIQAVESFWNVQKSKIKTMKGIKAEKLDEYLKEFM
ncbi:hypothetical protein NGRA_2884 [Nosema granulosis]|uniref:ISXO2-like transposase domain-containing protein n=1 Tax=Nosema granulosis TaxID=83296 RepID=A0A9P6GWJ8_9MICR|nr:hypothetical protein NGRA_2884 [Nosema granulosis]